MKTAIIYYSFSGNTRRLAKFLENWLTKAGTTVELNELKLVKEEKSFFGQCMQAQMKTRPALAGADFDLTTVDLVVFAGPVWAFNICPALRTFIGLAVGLEGKKTAVLLTSGSGAKVGIKDLETILVNRQAQIVFSGAVVGDKCADDKYLETTLKVFLDSQNTK
jgi:FMN-dependent NADH-azoreductase